MQWKLGKTNQNIFWSSTEWIKNCSKGKSLSPRSPVYVTLVYHINSIVGILSVA